MKKQDESRELARGERIGRANQAVLTSARPWCRHLSVEMESSGFLAAYTGLPVGSHSVTCPHATSIPGGMNLSLILPEFVINHCRGCPHHSPTGNPSWGRNILADYERRENERRAREEAAARMLDDLRGRLRSLPAAAMTTSDVSERRILEWIEQLFTLPPESLRAVVANLSGAVPIAHELFGEPAVGALIEGARCEPFREPCLAVLGRLAEHRPDLDDHARPVAADALRAGRCLEEACVVLAPEGRTTGPPDADLVALVVGLQDHIRPIGGWPTRDPECPLVDVPPDYTASTRLLVRALDASPESVLGPLREGLRTDDKHRRVNVCGVIRQVAAHRLGVLRPLTDGLLASLELEDDMYGDSADEAACRLLARQFLTDPPEMDERLSAWLSGRSVEVQAAIIAVYRHVFRAGQGWSGQPAIEAGALVWGQATALHRCLSWLTDDSLDLKPRRAAVDAIDSACHWCPEAVLPAFDRLFGTVAQLRLHEEPPPPRPRFVLPGERPPPPELIALEQRNREMTWGQFKTRVERCLEQLVEERPAETVAGLVAAFGNLDTATHERFKATVLTLLGKAGGDAGCRPLALPALWLGLMDYGSVLLRGVAVQALKECFRHSRTKPPANMVEILLVHLKDSYRLIHQSAIEALAWNTHWLADAQVPGVLDLVCRWASTYRHAKEPYHLERPIELVLALSRRLPTHRHAVVRWATTLFLNDGDIFDQNLLDELVRDVSPREPGAGLVAARLGEWLGGRAWHPFETSDERTRWFVWLHRLSRTEFRAAEGSLRGAALRAAVHNPYVATLFAGVFAGFGRFAVEAEITTATRAALPDGRLHAKQVGALNAVGRAADANHRRVSGA